MYDIQILCVIGVIVFYSIYVDENSDLKKLQREYWNWRLKESPQFSTDTGETEYNNKLTHYSIDLFEQRYNKANSFLQRLNTIESSTLNERDYIDYLIFKDNLQTYVDGYRWRNHNPLNPVNFLEGLTASPSYFVSTTPLKSFEDYENYLSRLQQIPTQFEEYQSLMRHAIKLGNTYNNVSVVTVPGQIDAQLEVAIESSVFYEPFVNLTKLSLTKDTIDMLRASAKTAVADIKNALRQLKNFLITEYMPATRTTWGISGWTNGLQNYEACLKWHLSLDMTAQQVHQKGLEEVDRIEKLMNKAINRLNFSGTIPEFFNMIRTDDRFHIQSADVLLKKYKNIVHNQIYPKLTQLFQNIPDLPVEVQPMPYNGAGGEYLSGTADGSRPGVFYVNLIHPELTATIDMMALSLHETVPGHHLQDIYALTESLPKYRKYLDYYNYYDPPYKFPFYTAYIEGWALYSEYLGEELGLYTDDYDLMGRYGSEMFRACRLVVDTGLHYFNWNRTQAINYMLERTAYSKTDITLEVDRYLTWPGQACAYKIGELKIKELREKAERLLGVNFDIKEFHSILLNNGPVPLRVLEKLVNDWITKES